jgi:hypothetical protein
VIQKNHLKAARSVSDQARQCARAHFLIPRYLTVVDDGNGSVLTVRPTFSIDVPIICWMAGSGKTIRQKSAKTRQLGS